ncbi:MAG: Methyltransferase type 11 [Nocardioidaceae bacterium]|nr:Methyltransferase type 11 [Nocardioidaceae bacterium]
MTGPSTSGPSLSFGGVADRYDRSRPDYPPEAVSWLVGEQQARVLELGAGTGKLTQSLVGLGHLVLATDPDERMLHHLGKRVPDAFAATATAERIPAAGRSVDVVVAAQAFHWFDHDTAVPEIARVLRPGGVLSLVWNVRDEGIPWVKKLGRLIGPMERTESADVLDDFDQFEEAETQEFRHWQTLDRAGLMDLVASRSNVATLPADEREERLEEVGALYDDYGRGYEGMMLPYLTRCVRAVVKEIPVEQPHPATAYVGEMTQPLSRADLPLGVVPPLPKPVDGPDDGMLLIDFR